MANIGERVRKIRKERDITLVELAEAAGMDASNISKIERGSSNLSVAVLERLAKALEVEMAHLIDQRNALVHMPAERRIAVWDRVEAGSFTGVSPTFTGQDTGEYAYSAGKLSEDAFALKVHGDSMWNPNNARSLAEADLVFVDPLVSPHPGDIVIALNEGGDATVKQYRPLGRGENGQDVFELVPINPFHPALRSDRQQLRILGTVVEVQRRLR